MLSWCFYFRKDFFLRKTKTLKHHIRYNWILSKHMYAINTPYTYIHANYNIHIHCVSHTHTHTQIYIYIYTKFWTVLSLIVNAEKIRIKEEKQTCWCWSMMFLLIDVFAGYRCLLLMLIVVVDVDPMLLLLIVDVAVNRCCCCWNRDVFLLRRWEFNVRGMKSKPDRNSMKGKRRVFCSFFLGPLSRNQGPAPLFLLDRALMLDQVLTSIINIKRANWYFMDSVLLWTRLDTRSNDP